MLALMNTIHALFLALDELHGLMDISITLSISLMNWPHSSDGQTC